jgi:hypothetical protein
MTVHNADMPSQNDVEFATEAANAAQLVPDVSAELDEEIPTVDEELSGLEAEPVEDAAQEEPSGIRGAIHTREAYLKKGEDLIRSLL